VRFGDRLAAVVERNRSLLCVGLDPDIRRFPLHLQKRPDAIIAFNHAIIEATADLVCAYKPNLGFFLAYGEPGIHALVETRRMVPAHIPVILDAKVGDIASTAEAYARAYFDLWGFDAVTAHPFLGGDSLVPWLQYQDRAVFILAKTSNPGSGDLQDLVVGGGPAAEPLYLHVAAQVAGWQEQYGTCGLVAGATYPRQLHEIRRRCPDLPILVPGIGAQSGDLAATVRAGLDAQGTGLLINTSRAVLYASGGEDFAGAARGAAQQFRDQINRIRSENV
jgi:orotidine-5'-phosphate decarboxylase